MESNPVRKQKYIFKERGFFNNEYQLIFIRFVFFGFFWPTFGWFFFNSKNIRFIVEF